MKFVLSRYFDGVFYHSDNEDGTVKVCSDKSQAKQFTADELLAFGASGGERTAQNWQALEAPIVTPGGSTNPPSSGLPDKPSITNEQ